MLPTLRFSHVLKTGFLTTFLACAFAAASFCQGTGKVYLDRRFRPVAQQRAAHYYRVIEDAGLDGLYPVKWYDMESRLVRSGFYSSLDSNTRSGRFTYYSAATGSVTSEGNYVNNKADGEWRDYYSENGALRCVKRYSAGEVTDSLHSYYPSGRLKRKERYERSYPAGGVCYAENGERIDYTPYHLLPSFLGGPEALRAFLIKNLKYPNKARNRNIEGRVRVSFFVDEEGNLLDAEVVQSVSPELDAEALRVVNMMKKWKPGRRDDEPVTTEFALPVKFTLE